MNPTERQVLISIKNNLKKVLNTAWRANRRIRHIKNFIININTQ